LAYHLFKIKHLAKNANLTTGELVLGMIEQALQDHATWEDATNLQTMIQKTATQKWRRSLNSGPMLL
jgi:hypothetical protein